MVDKEGIKIDQDKTKAILEIKPPKNLKQIREFVGKSRLRRFITPLASIIKPLHQLTKKNGECKWTPEHQQAFEEIKHILTNPRVMSAPLPNKEHLVYLTTSEEAIGILIA
ncbi:hypothetical protein TorRG33x02_258100 [Trema orientale]|uniref:Reverse transcriptase/retrotransposon-derived protein RNase H-like domain-containing protein n=1 Tax=Trema orientale TaxID=63057 RepID=A0A2P5D9V4_TREOI|nr:hypothetical protein TorRG33x02_258100 [Trema orientale]